MRVAVLLLAFSAVCYGILPDIVDSGISHILGDDYGQGQTELDPTYVEVEQLQEDAQQKPEDGLQVGVCFSFSCMTKHYFTSLNWNELIVYKYILRKLNARFIEIVLSFWNMQLNFSTPVLNLKFPRDLSKHAE